MRIRGTMIGALALALVVSSAAGASGALEEPPPDRGQWRLIGELDLARSGHTATLLPDGSILVVGGRNNQGRAVLTAELVYPRSGATRPAGTLPWGLSGHQAVLLPDGRVLLSGSNSFDGTGFATDQDHCAPYPPLTWDPETLRFAPLIAVTDSNGASPTLLADGRVLFSGGGTSCDWDRGIVGLDGSQVWDPATGALEDGGRLTSSRSFHPSLLLDDGRVLVAGGTRLAVAQDLGSSVSLVSFESWDPRDGSWTALGDSGMHPTSLALLSDGRVVVSGESVDGEGGAIEIYDPAGRSFVPRTEDWPEPLTGAAMAQLGTDQLLFVGGRNKAGRAVPTALAWDAVSGERTRIKYPRDGADQGHTATALPDGTVIVIGGRDDHREGRVLGSVEALRTTS